MDQGIIQNAKVHYRRRVIDRKLDAIEYDYEYIDIDIKTAIEYLVAAWKEVTPQTIKNCWRKAGFVEPTTSEVEEVVDSNQALDKYYESCKKLQEIEEFDADEFLNIDNNLNCVETYETDEDLINTIRDTQEAEEEEEENVNENQTQRTITKREARDLIEQLKQFYYSNSNDCCSEISKLQEMQDNLNHITSVKQASIESFFKKA
jgi:hypothetical protein